MAVDLACMLGWLVGRQALGLYPCMMCNQQGAAIVASAGYHHAAAVFLLLCVQSSIIAAWLALGVCVHS
jgi:hypothetical protein